VHLEQRASVICLREGKAEVSRFSHNKEKIVVGERKENLLACVVSHQAPSWFFPQQSNPPEVHS